MRRLPLQFVFTAVGLALGGLARNPLRAGLTTLGILIGVAAVTLSVALGRGATRAVAGSIDSLGENALIVIPRDRPQSGAVTTQAQLVLTEGDVEAIAREAPSVGAAAPLLVTFTVVAFGDASTGSQIIGTRTPFFEVRAWKLRAGQLWSPEAEALGARECVIGTTLRDELFGGADPVGQTLRIGRHPYRIVGLLESKGQSPFGMDQDKVVVMPIAALRSRVVQVLPGHVDTILLGARTPESSPRVEREVSAILRQRHGLAEGAENDFQVRSQEEFRKTQEQILGVLRSLLLGIAAVSLVVGGIGVMNIMLVSVTERTREIGIRMAIGARERDILAQFLLEAVLLSLFGGAAGTALSALAAAAIGRALGWDLSLSLDALGAALLTSATVGIGFGFVPARRAARLEPIEALGRH